MNQDMHGQSRSLLKTILCAITMMSALFLWSQNASATVTAVTLKAAKKVYSGDCPAKVVFNGTIKVNAPGTVSYIFTRSDGATDMLIKKLKFLAAGTKSVSTTWTLGGAMLPHYKGWQTLKVTGPNVIESTHADFEVRCDPPLNSAKAAHGNTDWHIDTANEFLFGKDMAGNNTAANFVPAGWTKTHIHVGESNAAKFYSDKDRILTGVDTNATNGIDKPMLFFYAGHGNPTTWNALGTNGHPADTLLGNIEGGGQLRYYWQCSCEVFAHGPRVCSGGDCDYSAPEDFDGSADSVAMRNVFERWGPAVGNDLRMACGVSTLAYCHESNVNAIWNKFNNEGSSVAEAFILGLGNASVKPLCITRGGSKVANSPLYDETFTNKANVSGNNYLHILYSGGTQTQPPMIIWKPELIPLKLWRVRLMPPGDPIAFKRRVFMEKQIERFRAPQIAGGSAILKRTPESGAIHLKAVGTPTLKSRRSVRTLDAHRRMALDFVKQIGLDSDDIGAVQVTSLMTASMPEKGARKQISRGEKNVIVNIGRRVRNGDHTLDVIGIGGRTVVKLAPGGEILSVARTWRKAAVTREAVAIKPFERAKAEAMNRLSDADAYKLAEWRFGYKEATGNVAQSELPVVYSFDFVPIDREKLIDYPPQQVEISAEEQ